MSAELLLIALVGAAGAFCIADGIFGILPRAPRQAKGLDGAMEMRGLSEEEGKLTIFDDAPPFLDRLFGPVIRDLVGGVKAEKRADLASRLRRSGWKYKSVADFYGTRVVLTAMFFGAGAVFMFVTGEIALFWVPLALGALGFFIPERELKSAIDERRKLVLTEMAFGLDRLALLVLAGIGIEQAMSMLAEAPGGAFIAALRQAARSLSSGAADASAVMAELRADLPADPEVAQFASRIVAGVMGTPVGETLMVQAERLRAALNARLLKEGLQIVLVITTIGAAFMLPALALVILGPPLLLAFRIF